MLEGGLTSTNRQITLAARPLGYPKETDFKLVEGSIPTPGPSDLLLRTIYLSVDPYMRSRMNDAKSYASPVQIGQVMQGANVCEVVASNHPDYQKGDLVLAAIGWQEYGLSNGTGLRKLDPAVAPVSTALGVLGMPGLTAYFGLLDICSPQPGETVVVSGAAGAVGSLVGQIAKLHGCRVVGIAGTDAKVDHLVNELGFDAAFNYKTATDYASKLKELCPNGIDVYFDNVGGLISDAVFSVLNVRARVSICGQIAHYNEEQPQMGPRLLGLILFKQIKVEGFMAGRYYDRAQECRRQMVAWLREGKLQYREDVVEGIENTPSAFIGMLKGQNIGKQLVKMVDR